MRGPISLAFFWIIVSRRSFLLGGVFGYFLSAAGDHHDAVATFGAVAAAAAEAADFFARVYFLFAVPLFVVRIRPAAPCLSAVFFYRPFPNSSG